jgi:ABC-type transport system involved in multi-copper enzyme maturation permease subunit
MANGSLDIWKATFRFLGAVAFLIPAAFAFGLRGPGWLKAVTGLIGVVGAGVVIVSMFTNPVHTSPQPFLVPNGVILIILGLVYLGVSLGICSDNQFVTLTRREFSAYFVSGMGYLVLAGMILLQWWTFLEFVNRLSEGVDGAHITLQPIVQHYFFGLASVIAAVLLPSALTMRLVSEEKRTGSLEVLLTAPVSEWSVILSKFVATWLFYIVCWLPSALFLVTLRVEIDRPFDYLPLLSFFLCLAVQGVAFVGIGLFFSTITRNQIVAAVLTFVVMFALLLCYFIRNGQIAIGFPPFLRTALGHLSFVHMWGASLGGRLPLRDVLLFTSIGAFWVFLSVKILETRKWS